MARQIPDSGINLFQLIYTLLREYEEKAGKPAMNLSLGNPDLAPPSRILELQSELAGSTAFELHTYSEENNLRGFAEAMVELHGKVRVEDHREIRALPIPGIKTAGALMPLACGLHLPDSSRRHRFRVISNLPAYDVIGTWSQTYLGAERIVWPLTAKDGMRLRLDRLKRSLAEQKIDRGDLVYVISPGNPAAVGSTAEDWRPLIEYCLESGTRLVNDAAYAGLADEDVHCPLAQVAVEYEDLEWIEMYSVSKSFSDPGARLGALAGSADFVTDFVLVKGNTESGPVPYVMAAYGDYISQGGQAAQHLRDLRSLYARRVNFVVDRLQEAGLELACEPNAGFFTLWKVPERIFGISLADHPRTRDLPAHEAFNRLVIEETGIVGVHFMGPGIDGEPEPFIRYAVCTDVLDPKFQDRFGAELSRLRPEYASEPSAKLHSSG